MHDANVSYRMFGALILGKVIGLAYRKAILMVHGDDTFSYTYSFRRSRRSNYHRDGDIIITT